MVAKLIFRQHGRMPSITVTLRQLNDAVEWARAHVRDKHNSNLTTADFKILEIPGSSIATRTVVICEACERVRVSDANHHDITDYDNV